MSEPEESTDQPIEQPLKRSRTGWHGAAILIGVLIAILGFAIAVQVRQNSRSDALSGLREDDLIGILDNQNARADRLRQQISDLQQSLLRLQTSGDRDAAARQQAQQEAAALGVLLGTIPASGPGVTVVVTDPGDKLQAEDLLDIIEELRGAGAEAMQVDSVRVSTTTSFTDKDGAIVADGTVLRLPYMFVAIGDSTTLDTALNIPGGVAAAVRALGGQLTVLEKTKLTISVTRALPQSRYAKPTH